MELIVGAIVLGIMGGAVYALMAAGLTLSFGVLEVINIAQGILVILAGYFSFTLQQYLNIDPFVGVLITTPAMFVLGYIIEWTLLRPLKEDRVALSILMTYAASLMIEGVLSILFTTSFVQLHGWYVTASFELFGTYISYAYLFGFLLSMLFLGIVYWILYRSDFGYALRATVQNRDAAVLIGIDVQRISTMTFAISTALTAAGGMLFGALNAFDPNSSVDLISRLLMIIILGGMGSMIGALVASEIMLVSVSIIAVIWSPTWSTFVFFALIIAIMVTRPQGLFGFVPTRKA